MRVTVTVDGGYLGNVTVEQENRFQTSDSRAERVRLTGLLREATAQVFAAYGLEPYEEAKP